MGRVLAFAANLPRTAPRGLTRTAIVTGCALALILAGQALPF